jgi:hypothetical protein
MFGAGGFSFAQIVERYPAAGFYGVFLGIVSIFVGIKLAFAANKKVPNWITGLLSLCPICVWLSCHLHNIFVIYKMTIGIRVTCIVLFSVSIVLLMGTCLAASAENSEDGWIAGDAGPCDSGGDGDSSKTSSLWGFSSSGAEDDAFLCTSEAGTELQYGQRKRKPLHWSQRQTEIS